MKQLLNDELKTYESNKSKLVKENLGKYVLIKDTKIIGVFESEKDAIKVGIEKFGNSPFLVKKIEVVEEPQKFTSNLIKCESKCHH